MKHLDDAISKDIGKGFGSFVDEVLRGRSNKTILNASAGLAALKIGIPAQWDQFADLDIARMVVNNSSRTNLLNDHPLFHLEAPTEAVKSGFTLFGLDFHDFWNQLAHGEPSRHITPFYEQSLAETLGLPNLPYGEMAHLAHLAMALYDTGRTFQDVWRETADYYKTNNTSPIAQGLALAGHMGKAITHPDMLHTLAAKGVMLTVMGLLHPLGPLVAIGVSYLCMHLVHSAFGVLERNKESIAQIASVPVLGAIYNASGMKEWAERDLKPNEEYDAEQIDAFARGDAPAAPSHRSVAPAQHHGRMEEALAALRPSAG
jgi:hypothetical protein